VYAAYAASIYNVGKESNFLEEVESGLLHDLDEVQEIYFDPRDDLWTKEILPILKRIPRAVLARRAGVSERYIQLLRNGKRRPGNASAMRLIKLLRG